MKTDSKTLCVLPWTHVFADERGQLFPCCFSHESAITNNDGRPYRFSVPGDVEEAWNSGFMKGIRRTMMEGGRPPECSSCWKTEDLGGRSYRHDQNQSLHSRDPEALVQLVNRTQEDGTAPLDIRFIDIRLGNLCNLRCRMCSPHSSLLLVDEFAEIGGFDKNEPWLQSYLTVDWYKEQAAWAKLEPHLANLNRLHFAGGEPLLVKEGFEFLRRIIRAGHAKKIRISYNSNITRIPEEALELWPEFAAVNICASVDGTRRVNDYVRHPSKWRDIAKNLMFLDRESWKHGVTSVQVHATIQIYNVLNITDLFRYAFENFRFISPYLYMDLVMNKPYLDVQILPESYRRLAVERIDSFVEWLQLTGFAKDLRHHEDFLARVHSIKNYLLAGERPELADDFRRATAISDRHRRQRLADYIPDLAPFYHAEEQAQPFTTSESAVDPPSCGA